MSSIYEMRLHKLRGYLEKERIEIALITNPTNIYYYTGFHSNPHERFMGLIVDLGRARESMILPALDLEAAQQHAFVRELIPCSDSENPYNLLREQVGRTRIGALGLEKKAVNLHQVEQLQGLFAGLQVMDIEPFIIKERLVKSEQDLVSIRRAVDIAEKVLESTVQNVRVGMMEQELAAELAYKMRMFGGDKPAFESIILTGKRSAMPHGKPGACAIQENDFVLFDFGVYMEGFCSDITRTFLMGEGTKEQSTIYETVLTANLAAIQAVKVGFPYGTIDQAGRSVIAAMGYGAYFNNRIGHGLGMDLHEAPSIHGESEMLIEPGHVFTIEPGIYLSSLGGVRIEDDVYVHPDGHVEVLTRYPKQLRRL
ncbi:Xaa-Pro peptidase family protein [Paenibacillus sp. HWE-109]|uniref:M24 family metallopeptidase n=1 Tax=Paenibacillus sp. HWE-109 TaxID=1306526 RepID=UPI001EE091AA|nr:Xaa-Pro peptidase family protein [Paenibacillus sp. HWE-109]UKS27158.1 Xaa-Pro peptidase family protein [Paenibacillus sp. HWE-109]